MAINDATAMEQLMRCSTGFNQDNKVHQDVNYSDFVKKFAEYVNFIKQVQASQYLSVFSDVCRRNFQFSFLQATGFLIKMQERTFY